MIYIYIVYIYITYIGLLAYGLLFTIETARVRRIHALINYVQTEP